MKDSNAKSWAALALIVIVATAALAMTLQTLERAEGERVERRSLTSPGEITGLSYDGEVLWTTLEGEGLLYRLDPETGDVLGRQEIPWTATGGSAWDGEYLWQMAWEADTIYKLEMPEGRVVDSIPTPGEGSCAGLTFDGTHLWVANWDDYLIFKVDQRSNGEVLATYKGNYETTGLAWDGRRMWTGLLIGTQYHGEEVPETAFIQRWRPETSSTEAIDTDMVLAIDGVGPGTSNWLPGVEKADRFWWWDAFNRELVIVDISPTPVAGLRNLAIVLWALVLAASGWGLFGAGRARGASRAPAAESLAVG
ncbi:MAG: glutaminyl-peptide cyclotransferase [Acidobacteriota bacterium]